MKPSLLFQTLSFAFYRGGEGILFLNMGRSDLSSLVRFPIRSGLWFNQRHLRLGELNLVLIICPDNSLHEVMANHIAFVEVHECETLDLLQYVGRFEKTTTARAG